MYVGRNEFEHYLDDDNVDDIIRIGLDTTNNHYESVVSSLSAAYFSGNREIVWVGTDSVGATHRKGRIGHQPSYDIDIFLAVGPKINEEQLILRTYYVGYNPRECSTLDSLVTDSLNLWLDSTYIKLERDLDSVGIPSKFINIDTPIKLKSGSITQTFPMVNGLFECIGETINYYIPAGAQNDTVVNEIIAKAREDLKPFGVDVIPIMNSHDGSAGIRCKVKVVKRK